jgi:branched-subunit amino acid aminotransferase/4-amino-4-deoxychorismate lyase
LFNEAGQVTEFTIGSLVLQRAPGAELVTPPVNAGVLPGVHRASLLAAGALKEDVVTLEEVRHPAARLWLLNSVRGWVPVTLL